MITKAQASALRASVERLVKARVALSWLGSQHPEDHADIERAASAAHTEFNDRLRRLTEKGPAK